MQWLSQEVGYKSRITYSDAEYFNLSEKEVRTSKAKRQKSVPTLEQIQHVLAIMPDGTPIEKRDRAIIAFTLLTGARDSATASMKLKHIDMTSHAVYQDAREVNTKFSKTFTTYFFPVGDEITTIFNDWVEHLKNDCLFGNDDPLFLKTRTGQNRDNNFQAVGLSHEHWQSVAAIRKVFRQAFTLAELPYFNPHSFRHTLAMLGEKLCQTLEEFKAWSQNLGHEGVLTTFYSYGEVQEGRQSEIFKRFDIGSVSCSNNGVDELATAIARKLNGSAFEL